MYTRKFLFPVYANNIPVGFYQQKNENQIWWIDISMTEANRQGNSKKPQEKTVGQIDIFLSFYPGGYSLSVYTQRNYFSISLLVFCIPLWVCAPSRKFQFPVVINNVHT